MVEFLEEMVLFLPLLLSEFLFLFFEYLLLELEEDLAEFVVFDLDVCFLKKLLQLGAECHWVLLFRNRSFEFKLFSLEVEFDLNVWAGTLSLPKLLHLPSLLPGSD